jgi:hypothetical protein
MKNNNPSFPKRARTGQKIKPSNAILESPQEMLRKEIDKLKEMAQSVESLVGEALSISDLVRLLEVRGKTSTRIASLLKTEKQLSESGNTMDAFAQALDEVIKELEKN